MTGYGPGKRSIGYLPTGQRKGETTSLTPLHTGGYAIAPIDTDNPEDGKQSQPMTEQEEIDALLKAADDAYNDWLINQTDP